MTFTGYIYKITGACGLVYIGSTNNIVKRKSYHKTGKINSSSSRLLLKPLQFDIIDTREYKLMKTLHLVEQFYLDNTNTINQRRAYTNNKKYMRNYRSINSEKIKYQERVWRENNKEIINKSKKLTNEKYKEKYTLQKKEKIKCVCGCLISRRNLSQHKRTKKHLELMNLL